MPAPIALLLAPGSSLDAVLGPRIVRRGGAWRALSASAPMNGGAVTIRPGEILWEDVDLLRAGAVLLERPEFPWPQPQNLDGLPVDPDERLAAIAAEREARALGVSALFAAAERAPFVNPPASSHLAASPASALDRAASAGIAVRPWRLDAAPHPDAGGAIVLDSVGRDRWHAPDRPDPGEPALVLDPVSGRVVTYFVAGPRVGAALTFEDAGAWASRGLAAGRFEERMDSAGAALAVAAAEACGLAVAAVTVAAGANGPETLFIDAAPEHAAWHRLTDGRTLDALADHLVHLASAGRPATTRSSGRNEGAP